MNRKIINKNRLILSVSSLLLVILMHPVVFAAGAGNVPDLAAGQYGEPDDGIMKHKPGIQNLGQGRYRIGSIKIDKVNRTLTVPGKMLPYGKNKAIEFLATMKQGYKAYESVLSLDVNAFEFNLACILIGLDEKKSVSPRFHFDPGPVEGDRVSIKISWRGEQNLVNLDVIDLLNIDSKKPLKPSIWSYTGSSFTADNRYMAQMDGVLIGMIHDPASIIEHRTGLGLGNWGAITIDEDIAPKAGQQIEVSISFVE